MPSLKVKLSDGTTTPMDVPEGFQDSMTVKQLKEHFAAKINIEAPVQRMVFKGKILKDEDLVKTVGLDDGMTVHIVKGRAPGAPANTVPTPVAETSTASSSNASGAAPAVPDQNNVAAANPYAALFGGGMGGGAGMGMGGTQQGQQGQGAANPMMGGGMGMWPGMGGGMGQPGAGGGMDPMAAQMANNPQMMQMAMQMWQQNPQMMAEMTRNHPMFQSMEPQQREAVLGMMSNPQMMQQLMAMQQGGGGGMGGGMGQQQPGGGAPNPMAAMMGGMGGGMGGGGGGFGAPQAPANPRETYKDQLAQLSSMGFPNEEANIAALVQSQGSVDFAIEKLLNS